MIEFEALGRILHKDEARRSRLVFLTDGMSGLTRGPPENLSALRCNLRSCCAGQGKPKFGTRGANRKGAMKENGGSEKESL